MSQPFLGEIRMFGFNFAPRGWAFCSGSLLPITQFQAVFSLLGTTYGGDGRTTFALPDLRSRVAINQGQGPGLSSRVMGEISGEEAHTLTAAEMPTHTHSQPASSSDASVPKPGSAVPAAQGAYAATSDGALLSSTTAAGSSQAHNNMQPYAVVNFCIALEGIFPSRN